MPVCIVVVTAVFRFHVLRVLAHYNFIIAQGSAVLVRQNVQVHVRSRVCVGKRFIRARIDGIVRALTQFGVVADRGVHAPVIGFTLDIDFKPDGERGLRNPQGLGGDVKVGHFQRVQRDKDLVQRGGDIVQRAVIAQNRMVDRNVLVVT